MTEYRCTQCNQIYPDMGLPHVCPHCGGMFEICRFTYPSEIFADKPGLWRYQACFGLESSPVVPYLGEGETPLISKVISGNEVFFKLENLNPTGSYKDRGTTVLIHQLLSRKIDKVVEDSSGNAGASLATYCAAFGIGCKIFIPESASGPKRLQMEAAGTEVIPVPGERQNASKAVLSANQESGLAYASHALQPFGMAGITTIAFEIVEQLGKLPGTVVAPVGHGSLFAGLLMGFDAVTSHQKQENRIQLIGVQPELCAPLVAQWNNEAFIPVNKRSIAEGTMIKSPVHGSAILQQMKREKDNLISVSEDEILPAYRELARMGFFVEPTSAMVWAAYKKHHSNWRNPVVLILTGTGLKYN